MELGLCCWILYGFFSTFGKFRFTFWGKKKQMAFGVVKTLGCESYCIVLGFFSRLCCFFNEAMRTSHFLAGDS